MKNLTDEEIKLLDNAGKNQPAIEWFTLFWWSLFYPKRERKFIDCIVKGMSWKFAKIEAKQ